MSKYITHFQTEAAYQSALPTLDLPNVSLVDELGEVHYHRALYGAHAGDIALYDVAEAQKIVVTAEDWNLTAYPTASYPIIGVVAADETAAGCKVISVLGMNNDGTTTNTGYQKLAWVSSFNVDWGLTKYTTAADAKTDFNGKTNTATAIAAIKAYDLAHSTDNITGKIGYAIEKFAPTGTVAGDWYVPAAGEADLFLTNLSVINASIAKIRNADSSLSVSQITLTDSNYSYHTSTEKTADYDYRFYKNVSNYQFNTEYKSNLYFVIPFTII